MALGMKVILVADPDCGSVGSQESTQSVPGTLREPSSGVLLLGRMNADAIGWLTELWSQTKIFHAHILMRGVWIELTLSSEIKCMD